MPIQVIETPKTLETLTESSQHWNRATAARKIPPAHHLSIPVSTGSGTGN